MKYVSIYPSDTLSDLTERVGIQNIDQVLADNGLERTPNIGQSWKEKISDIQSENIDISGIRKVSILNQFIDNSDIYQEAALADNNTWKVLSSINSFPNYLYISDQLESYIPDSYQIIGNTLSVSDSIRTQVETWIKADEAVDSNIFASVNTIQDVGEVASRTTSLAANPMTWFKIPYEEVVLYSSLTGMSLGIPSYPEEVNDERSATYATMPDLLYQYEPWQMYQSSGPRSNTYSFHLHRDMWTGDHKDGKANELIRFCQAQCYPVYNGSAVISPTVTLYVSGSPLITGIMTNVKVNWTGPIGDDGFYLEFTLELSITEVSPTALDHNSVMSKPLIG